MSEKPAYILIERFSAQGLVDAVNQAVAEGYQPLGGVSVATAVTTHENARKGGTEEDIETVYVQALGR